MKLRNFGIAIIATLAFGSAAARPHYSHHYLTPALQWPLGGFISPVSEFSAQGARVIASALPHPSGCPARAFCACGAAADLGLHSRSLWLASAWYRFPRSAPGYNTVAVRPHHVFVLKQPVGGTKWLVADYNSGGHRSRLHVRDISGYTIVNPHS